VKAAVLLLLQQGRAVSRVGAICRYAGDLATITNCSSQALQDVDGGIPVDTRVGDADTGLQASRALGGHLLVAFANVGLNHDADNGGFTSPELVGDASCNLGLVAMVLVGVACKKTLVLVRKLGRREARKKY